jgi:hypothetical protein
MIPDKDSSMLKTLHADELQSTWHEKGRDVGYKIKEPDTNGWTAKFDENEGWKVYDKDGNFVAKTVSAATPKDAIEDVVRYRLNKGAVPDAPFKDNGWVNVGLKQLIQKILVVGLQKVKHQVK